MMGNTDYGYYLFFLLFVPVSYIIISRIFLKIVNGKWRFSIKSKKENDGEKKQ